MRRIDEATGWIERAISRAGTVITRTRSTFRVQARGVRADETKGDDGAADAPRAAGLADHAAPNRRAQKRHRDAVADDAQRRVVDRGVHRLKPAPG